jgi:hypothetical protein
MGDERTGLERALSFLAKRHEYDLNGRIVGGAVGGKLPRFVWVRAAEGTIWRFRFDMRNSTVSAIAKLAGREGGWTQEEGRPPRPPERLDMIGRLLKEEASGVASATRRERMREGETAFGPHHEFLFDP